MDGKQATARTVFKMKNPLFEDYIPFLGGRPKRGAPINQDDIANLKIDLWRCPSIEEFLRRF
ncbi:MAG: hypothetical protein A2293_14265 [Elusimicrobia bacterium RIFOXYB2_FULL_49_7]|nr:MAG: hypothetical protein A2293_14265 [Elusimicrobia bacterium RIFOXYB2_FULL_49_7]